ncbi:MAG: DUF1565 domain-containing protein [Myxococcales bacterium]|nr:DUF1565 domain-containing protein [Myxococcales bacterium]
MTRSISLALALLVLACGSDDNGGGKSGTGGSSSGGSAGTPSGGAGGASGGTGGASGGAGGASGGAGGASGGAAGSGGSGATGGTGGTPGACGAITTFADGLTPTKQVHVAPSGDDASGDGSAQKPFKTLGKAAQGVTAGTAIRLHAGTYAGGAYLSNLSGSASAPIWIGGAPGEATPVLDGGGEGLHLTKVRYLVLHDLEVKNSTQNGVNVDDGGEYANADATRYVLFRNLNVHDVGSGGNQDCLKLSGLNDFWVLDSKFARCGGGGSGSGIDHVGCHKGLIARSSFEEISGNAVQAKGGSEDIEIRACRMKDAGERAVNMGGSTGLQFFRPPLSTSAPNFEAKNIRVVANVISGSTAALAFVGCVECLAAHNTIVDPTNWLFRILQETTTGGGYTFLPAQKGRFVNNLVYFDRSDLSTWVNVGANTDAASFQFQNNLWYAHDNPAQSQPTNLPAAETGGISGTDPALTNPAGGDYSIPQSSAAAGKGSTGTGVAGDFTGKCYASPPSVGAFEPLP